MEETNDKKLSPFDIAKNINGHQDRLDAEDVAYNAFMVNRVYSNTPDSVHFANELNMHWDLSKQMQYDFYRFGLNKNPRRYGKWEKRTTEDNDNLEVIKEAYGVSRVKALELLPILKDKMFVLKKYIEKGGKK